MASYDWFLMNLKKIGNPNAKDIGRTVYVIENIYTVKEAVIMNVEFGLARLKVFDKKEKSHHYKSVYYKNMNKTWFTTKEIAEKIAEQRLTDWVVNE